MSCQGHSLDLSSNNIPNSSWTEAFPQKGWARKLARFRAQFASTKSGLSAFTTEFFLLSVPRRSQKEDSRCRSETHALFLSM